MLFSVCSGRLYWVDFIHQFISLGLHGLMALDEDGNIQWNQHHQLLSAVHTYPTFQNTLWTQTDTQTHTGRITRYFPPRIPLTTRRTRNSNLQLRLQLPRTHMGILNLARISRDSPSVVYASKDWRGRDDHDSLSGCFGTLSGTVYS